MSAARRAPRVLQGFVYLNAAVAAIANCALFMLELRGVVFLLQNLTS